jgi:hypothetical protein
MVAIGDLNGGRRALSPSIGIQAGPIAGDLYSEKSVDSASALEVKASRRQAHPGLEGKIGMQA